MAFAKLPVFYYGSFLGTEKKTCRPLGKLLLLFTKASCLPSHWQYNILFSPMVKYASGPIKLRRFEWDKDEGPKRLWLSLQKNGIAWFRRPEAIERAETNPARFVKDILRVSPLNVGFTRVEVVKKTLSYETTNQEALFHTDISDNKQPHPHLQIMVCKTASRNGGESRFVDSWKLLSRIKNKSPAFYKSLFTQNRPVLTVNGVAFMPTFSWVDRNLICSHRPRCCLCDDIGRKFVAIVQATTPIEFLMEPGDVYVANNHRMLHGRNAFIGPRLYYRMNTYLRSHLENPKEHAVFARKVADIRARIRSL